MDNQKTIKEIADSLKVSKQTVLNYIKKYNIPKVEVIQGKSKIYYITEENERKLKELIGGYLDFDMLGGKPSSTVKPQNPSNTNQTTVKELSNYQELQNRLNELTVKCDNLQNQLEKQLEINVMLSQSIQSLTSTLSIAIEDKQETIEEIQEDNREVAEMQTETKKTFFNFFRK